MAVSMPDSMDDITRTLQLMMDWHLWVMPMLFIILSVLAGIIVEKLLLGAIRQILNHTAVALNEEIAKTLRGLILWIFSLWGVHMATYSVRFLQPATLNGIRQIVFVLAMLLAVQIIAKISVAIIRFSFAHSSGIRTLPNTSIFENIIRFVIFGFGLIMILQTMGVSVMPLITALGVGGLAISLGLQDTLANLFAGINMLLARQIKVGDIVQLENGLSGKVEDIGWRTTVLRQLSGNLIILPNSKLATNIIQNYTLPHPDLTVTATIPVSVANDLVKLEAITIEVATEVGKAQIQSKHPSRTKPIQVDPVVRYQAYGDSWLNMAVSITFKTLMDAGLVKHELIKALHVRFQAEGIEMPFPRRLLELAPSLEKTISSEKNQDAAGKTLSQS